MTLGKGQIRRILIVNLGGIGDVLLSMPAVRALRRLYPEARITFLGVGRTQSLVKNIKYFDETFSLEIYDDAARRFLWSKGAAAVQLLFALRRKKFDLALNMRTLVSWPSAIKMAFMFFIIGGRIKAGRDTRGRGFFLDVKIPESDLGDHHEMDYDLATAKALGADVSDRTFDPGLFGNKSGALDDLLFTQGIAQGDALIVIHPGGAPSHRWPAENFVGVAKTLMDKFSCKIIITGTSSETEIAFAIKRHFDRGVIDLSGKIELGDLAALLSRSSLFITNDSGPMHIAAILQVPMVAIFGPGYLKRFDPRVISPKSVVLYRPTACAPCNRAECSTLICLKDIVPKDVVDAASKLWKEAS